MIGDAMSTWALVAAVALGAAVLLSARPRPAWADPEPPPGRRAPDVRRHRGPAAAGALIAGCTLGRDLFGPVTGPVAGLVAAVVVWSVVARGETSAERRAADRARVDLPHLVGLAADGLRSGADPANAVRQAAAALPGPAANRLLARTHALGLGADPVDVWRELAQDPALGPLGRALGRAHDSGTPVAQVVAQLAEQLAANERATVEDRARRVGVRAAVPLGLCLLPSFVVLGIVPLAATLLGDLW